MSDPLSSFVEAEEEGFEDYSESSSSNTKSKLSNETCTGTGDSEAFSSSQATVEDINTQQHAATVQKAEEQEVEGVTRQDSNVSDYSDILAKIEEEMGTEPKDLDIVVENPEKVVKTMESFIAFSVKTKTTRSDFEHPEYSVKRRYNDFLWLRQQLEEKNPSLIIPPLPEKHNLTIDRFDKEFVKFRQVALHRFMGRVAAHAVTSSDELLKAFLTLESNDLALFKKQGSGLLSRMTKSLSTMGGSFMLKNRGEEYNSLYDYAQAFGDKMGAFERITSRIATEQQDYLTSMSNYSPAFESWAGIETELARILNEMAKLMSLQHDNCKDMVDETTLKILLPTKEYILFSESMKSALARRDAAQHELEVITEELVKCTDEKQQLDGATPGTGGFLSRSNTEETIKLKLDKASARISELESARKQCKAKLEERNLQLKTDLERWHINKKADMKEMLGGMATRHIDKYDKHITALEGALSELKKTMAC